MVTTLPVESLRDSDGLDFRSRAQGLLDDLTKQAQDAIQPVAQQAQELVKLPQLEDFYAGTSLERPPQPGVETGAGAASAVTASAVGVTPAPVSTPATSLPGLPA